MKQTFIAITLLTAFFIAAFKTHDDRFLSHTVDLKTSKLEFFSKDTSGNYLRNHSGLIKHLKIQGKTVKFAVNGGMYKTDLSPLGLYIENGIQIQKINRVKNAYGNFYMQPNGIFYIKNNKGVVCATTEYSSNDSVSFATQSGPMLLHKGKYNTSFKKGSKHINIRNGVGILPNGNILFVMSKKKVNLYDFAAFFKDKGCKDALYLDGFVSRTYLPSKNWKQTGGVYGIIIAEVD